MPEDELPIEDILANMEKEEPSVEEVLRKVVAYQNHGTILPIMCVRLKYEECVQEHAENGGKMIPCVVHDTESRKSRVVLRCPDCGDEQSVPRPILAFNLEKPRQ